MLLSGKLFLNHNMQTSELESIDLVLYNTSATSASRQENSSHSTSAGMSVRSSSSVALDEDTKSLWRRCNALLRSERKLTKLFIVSACIHLCVLVSVTVSVSK